MLGKDEMRELIAGLKRDEAGQMAVEYSLLHWFFIFIGSASLAWFLMAMEEAIVDYYQDIVSTVCLPIP